MRARRGRGEAAVRLPRVPSAARPAVRGARRRSAPARRRYVVHRRGAARPRSPTSPTRGRGRALIAGAGHRSTPSRAWSGEPGRSDAHRARRRHRPRGGRGGVAAGGAWRADPEVVAAWPRIGGLRSHNAKALMRWLLDQGSAGARPAARHRDRRLPHRPGRHSLRAARPARAVHARSSCPTSRPVVAASSTSAAVPTTARCAAREALAVAHLAAALEAALAAPGHGRPVRHHREPAGAGAGQDGARRHRGRRRRAARS